MLKHVLIFIIGIMFTSRTFYVQPTFIYSSYNVVNPTSLPPCGQYGFRCLDTDTYQICTIAYSDGATEQPEPAHECAKGLVCDEDNPAFCTPIDTTNEFKKPETANHATKSHHETSNQLHYYNDGDYVNDVDYVNGAEYYDYNEALRSVRDLKQNNARKGDTHEENCVCTTTETPPTTTTSTMAPVTEVYITTAVPYSCDTFGFFPDYKNRTTFWFCDVSPSGEGFLLHHMTCGPSRIFDPVHHACIIPGTIRNEAPNKDQNLHKKDLSNSVPFTCDNKKPGKYPDNNDCQNYYYCVPKTFLPIKHVLFSCPEFTAYDRFKKNCTFTAFSRCIELKKSKNCDNDNNNDWIVEETNSNCNSNSNKRSKINCKEVSRFREIKDCSRFYVCYGDQIFEMRCPHAYKYDDNLLQCVPEKIAKCFQ